MKRKKWLSPMIGLFVLLVCMMNFCTSANAETTWTFKDGVLTISGSGYMDNYSPMKGNTVPWKQVSSEVEKIVIEDGVTGIGDYAFFACMNVSEVKMPNTVVSVGEKAFLNCLSLTEVIVPDSVTEIGEYAFGYGYEEEEEVIDVDDNVINPSQIEEVYTKVRGFVILCSEDTEAAWYAEDNELKTKYHSFVCRKEVQATCVKQESHTYECKVCGYIYEEKGDYAVHLYGEGKVRKEASYYETGSMEFSCKVCGKTEVAEIPKLQVVRGTKFWVEKNQYRVVSAKAKTVMLISVENDPRKIVVPATVSFAGTEYKVTRIGEMSIAGKKKMQTAELGKNVKYIEARAFYNCTKLKTLIVRGEKIKFIGTDAFANTAKKVIAKVPGNKVKYYKKLFKRRVGKKVKVKKG